MMHQVVLPGLLCFLICRLTPMIWQGYQVVTNMGEQVKTYNSKKKVSNILILPWHANFFYSYIMDILFW